MEDDDDHARLVEEILIGDGRRVPEGEGGRRVPPAPGSDLAGARVELERHRADCILLDLFLPDGQGLESLTHLTTLDPLVPIVILTSLAEEQLGLQAVHEGAQDYLVKGSVDRPRLSRALRHAIGRKALEARFAEQALHDPLTGLANRTLLLDRIRLELAAARTGGGVAVFYLDVDDFKAVNDRWGHDAGDEVLVRVARRLARTVRPGDTVGRSEATSSWWSAAASRAPTPSPRCRTASSRRWPAPAARRRHRADHSQRRGLGRQQHGRGAGGAHPAGGRGHVRGEAPPAVRLINEG